MTSELQSKIKHGLRMGTQKGWRSFIWICKVVVPVSLAVSLLQWSGWLEKADFLFGPLMRLLHLPSEAALPLISATAVNIYAGIASMVVLDFTIEQMTLMAIFMLIAHNLIVEGIIQHKSGLNGIVATLLRLGIAVVAVLGVSQFFGDTTLRAGAIATEVSRASLFEALLGWGWDTLLLLLKILVLVVLIIAVLEMLTATGWIEHLFRLFQPFMKLLGLSNRASMLWVTAVVFGLMYGGAVIVEDTKRGRLTKADLEYLHMSIGINHSMVEDTALFMALGLSAFWLLVPKLLLAVISVQIVRAARYLKVKARTRLAAE